MQWSFAVEPMEQRLFLSASGSKIIFNDQFTGTSVDGRYWYIPKWRYNGDGTFVGRTQFRCSQNAELPEVKRGAARLVLDSYNPTGFSFYGTDLITRQIFRIKRGTVLDVRIRAKMNNAVGGVVGGLFPYMVKKSGAHDEVDTELLSNEIVSGKNRVETNVYANEGLGAGKPAYAALPRGGKLSGYHNYQMVVSPGQFVRWFVDGRLVRQETAKVPSGPFRVHLNIWAPASGWAEAYSSSIQPVSSAKKNRRYSMDVDSVVVRTAKAKPFTPTPPSDVIPGEKGIQITSVPALGAAGFAEGAVSGIKLSEYAGVAVFIKVSGGWWTKPYFSDPITKIQSDGTWKADIATGGHDPDATAIRAYLVPKGVEVPAMSGGSTFPESMSSLLYAERTR